MALTGLMTVVAANLVQNSGLEVNAGLVEQVNKFNDQNISASVQELIRSLGPNEFDPIIEILKMAPDFMTGLVPDGIQFATPITNVPQAILDQANTIFPDIPTFIAAYTSAVNYATEIFNFKGTVAAAQNTKFEDLGFQYKNYSDVASGGITNQFNAANVPDLAAELPNLGSLFPTSDLSKFGNISSISQSIVDQGLGYVGGFENKIKTEKIDLSNLNDSDYEVLLRAFQNITGAELTEVFTVTEFKPVQPSNIRSLADVLDIKNVLSDRARAAIGQSATFDDLARKFSNVGGSFKNVNALATFYSSIRAQSYDSINSMDSLLPPSMANELKNKGGSGTGFFGNPTVIDILGTVSGIGYVDDLTSINETQAQLLSTDPDVAEFKNYLDSGNVTVDQLREKIELFNAKPTLISLFQESERKYRNIAERLKLELANVAESKILENITPVNSSGILNFAGQLHTYSSDSMKLGTADLLDRLVTNDSSGDSIRACLSEGKNLSVLASAGINPGTQIDAMSYAKKISS